MTTIFNSKEQYIAFRNAWAQAVNDPRAKSTVCGTERFKGWVTGAHQMLYSILRNRPFDTGFTPITSRTKLVHGANINQGLYSAAHDLSNVVSWAQRVLDDEDKYGFGTKLVNTFLEPFNGTITVEMLVSIEVPDVKRMSSTYGAGRKVAQMIVAGRKPTTFQMLDEMFKEVA